MIINSAIAHKAASQAANLHTQDAETYNASDQQQGSRHWHSRAESHNITVIMQQLLADAAAYQARVPRQAQRAEAQFKQQFTSLAHNETQFHQLLQAVFGSNLDIDKAEALRQRALQADFSWLPTIKFIDAAILNGAAGAYAAESNTIFLSDGLQTDNSLLTTGRVFGVLVEEIGHSLDALLNIEDATGDEGALFRTLLSGAALASEQLTAMRAEDDTGVIEIDDAKLVVEYSKLSKEAGRFARRVNGFFSSIGAIIQAVGEQLSQVRIAAVELVKDVGEVLTTVLKRPFELTVEMINGVVAVATLVAEGKIAQAGSAARDTVIRSGKLALSLIPEVVAMSINAAIVAVDRARGAITERVLSAHEKAYLNPIFGGSLDYAQITIISGGLKDQLGMDAHVVGNEIFMPDELFDGTLTFNPDGSLTPGGLGLLGHEVAHVWQFQQHGTNYIGESLMQQVYDGEKDTYNWHHAVLKGTAFTDMNPERQAQVAGLIGQAIAQELANSGSAVLTISALNEVIGSLQRVITAEQFHLFEQAHAVLTKLKRF